jgi:hypothetical protein
MSKGRQLVCAIIRLPLEYNPDSHGHRRRVEDEKYVETAKEIAEKFGGGTLFRWEHGNPKGFWWGCGVLYDDDLAAIEVDVPDTRESRQWLREYARRILIARFEQEAIYIKFVGPIEQMIVEKEEIRK